MGAKDSKRTCLGYEDAVKRMSDVEFKRVCEAFKRLTGGKPLLSQQAFVQYVLGDGVPSTIAESLYNACGGSPRGIHLRDLICGLVLLTKGTKDEKIKFLWNLYSNDACTQITKADFLQVEGDLTPQRGAPGHYLCDATLLSLFGWHDRIGYEQFRDWIVRHEEATVLSTWLLTSTGVSLSSEVETPTFYQSLAGVTHLEERDICELEKCFWSLQSASPTGQLDAHAFMALVSPPVPASACAGLFLALDVNRDGHIDFKELCCGISAACRGPVAERTKFCFKLFDVDRDNQLDAKEFQHMKEVLLLVMKEHRNVVCKKGSGAGAALERRLSNEQRNEKYCTKALDALRARLDGVGCLPQEDFLVWCVEHSAMVAPLLELLFQVCHVSLGLRPKCRHHEHEIVTGWLEREQHRGLRVGQFWYLIANDWWQTWFAHTTAPRGGHDGCTCRPEMRLPLLDAAEEIVCDESFTSNSTDYTSHSNEFFASNSTDSMGDSCSLASSSGVSSSSGTLPKRGAPGPIDNGALVCDAGGEQTKVVPLTGEGSRLRRDTPLVQGRDFELIPDSLWKALALWYGSPLPLPRQVIRPPGSDDMELELYPLNLKVYRHQHQGGGGGADAGAAGLGAPAAQTAWATVGGYGAAALSSAGISSAPSAAPRRVLAHTAAFSRLASVRQVAEFLAARLGLRMDEARLWLVKESSVLLEEDGATLQDLGVVDADAVLLEVRNKDLTWPEELGALACGAAGMLTAHAAAASASSERRPTISLPPGATGLHNLGNTCFMNAALQAVSNTRPLTQYFRRDAQLCELNCSNPLGTKGQVARRYAELCRELWAGSTRSVAPLKLRWCVSKHAPNLGGGGQHDSQELLAWLLDTLHEDLNRVHRKQYTELRDSDGRPDAVVADEAWAQHLARDHSIITDLFYGQLKSKVTCQTCGHESVRFDAFNLLSLPLPMESYTLCEALVVRLDGGVPVKYGMRLNSEARYAELKRELERLSGVRASRLLVAEVACSRIRQLMKDGARINPASATELYAYELPAADEGVAQEDCGGDVVSGAGNAAATTTTAADVGQAAAALTAASANGPLARSPENARTSSIDMTSAARRFSNGVHMRRPVHSTVYTDVPAQSPSYLVAVHRKCVRQETYFLSQHKSKPSLFGVPLLLGLTPHSTCQSIYETVWAQVTRLLSPLPQSDQTNHAMDCDDSLGYEFPFALKAVLEGGQMCALCHWTQFCRGCRLPCSDALLSDVCAAERAVTCVAIDWDPTALHLRYQCSREKVWREHDSVAVCRKLHTEPIDLGHCLKAFTSEERLEAKYHCGSCAGKQPATKKLQIWRLPPILIVHLKRFDCVNSKWVKTQKVVNFPFRSFDPTGYLASVPQETILRHRQLLLDKRKELEGSTERTIVEEEDEVLTDAEAGRLVDAPQPAAVVAEAAGRELGKEKDKSKEKAMLAKRRQRLESTSLIKTPVIDEDLQDFHKHKLQDGADPFDLNYQLYAVVSHSGMLNGGHYISYACNPNGNWYCYNDSSCREVGNIEPPAGGATGGVGSALPKIDTSSAYILFYERAGLDYAPYFPDVVCNGGAPNAAPAHADDELDDNESELRKQCALQ